MNYDVWFVKKLCRCSDEYLSLQFANKVFWLKSNKQNVNITPQKLETVNDAYELVHIINRHT